MNIERVVVLPTGDEEWITEVSSDDENELDCPDEIPENIKEIIGMINYQAHLEVLEEVRVMDPVARNCDYRRFISKSNGRGRKERRARIIELLWYGKKCIALKGDNVVGGIDGKATEIFGESVDPEMATQTLLKMVRGLHKLK